MRRGRLPAARWSIESALDNATLRHHPAPPELFLIIDLGPERISRASRRPLDRRERDIRLGCRRPYGRGHRAHELAPLVVDERVPGWLVAGHVELHETIFRAALLLREQRATAREVRLLEVHEPFEAQLERRPRAIRAHGLI